MGFNINIGDDLEIDIDCRLEITNFKPERQAPSCSNPAAAAFSDSGDYAEYDIDKVILIVNGTEIEIDSVLANKIYEVCEVRVDSKVNEIGESLIVDSYEDAMIEKYEDDLLNKTEDYR